MKKLILTFGIFLISFFAVTAQNRMDAKATKMVDRINQVCGLTSDQSSKLQVVAEQYLKSRHANLKQYGSNPDQMQQANRVANQNYKAQLKTLLTPEQVEKLKAYNAQRKANRKGGQGNQEGEEQQEQGGGQQ